MCVKFSVDGVTFLVNQNATREVTATPSRGTPSSTPSAYFATMSFDRSNSHQSPLADRLLNSLPAVAEVMLAEQFLTVRRTDEDDEEEMALASQTFVTKNGKEEEEQGVGDHGAPAMPSSGEAVERTQSSEPAPEVQGSHPSAAPADIESQAADPALSSTDIHDRIRALGKTDEDGITELDEDTLRLLVRTASWDELRMSVCAIITDHLYSGLPHVSLDAPHPHPDTVPQEGDSEVVLAVKELIAESLRPMVQQDGGDLRLEGFCAETGVLSVEMLGACKTCKSSKTTLKDMIERTVQHWVPEVREVVEWKAGKAPQKSNHRSAAAEPTADASAPEATRPKVAESCARPVIVREVKARVK
jgi:Fe-S cluster biogenesis protein NfuA